MLLKTEVGLVQSPEQALLAWMNRRLGAEVGEEVDVDFQEIIAKWLVSGSWSARSVYYAIEEYYPFLSRDRELQRARKLLMTILRHAMREAEERLAILRPPFRGPAPF